MFVSAQGATPLATNHQVSRVQDSDGGNAVTTQIVSVSRLFRSMDFDTRFTPVLTVIC
jgi:hypothetical protein